VAYHEEILPRLFLLAKRTVLQPRKTLSGNRQQKILWRDTFRVLVVAIVGLIGCSKPESGKTIDESYHLIFVPSGLETDRTYPLAILLSPGADANAMIRAWRPIAEKHRWILVASKVFRNGVSPDSAFDKTVELVTKNRLNLPLDKTKIVASGFSGGGMGAHMLAFYYRELISGVIPNTGMIDDYFYARVRDYPKGKLAVLLASPTDFRYQNMKKDQDFLKGLGWKTKFVEFDGGHQMAPLASYDEAVSWFIVQWRQSSSE
jgi:predicted esterase